MSHQPERKDKNCLNCGTMVHGRFCHACGQENVVTHQKFWALAKHFIFDVLHFDGNFFHTLLYMFTKPGFVAREYVTGKRMRFLDPIRMYLFTSALFFLVFFSLNSFEQKGEHKGVQVTAADREEYLKDYQKKLEKRPDDTLVKKRLELLKDSTRKIDFDSPEWQEKAFFFHDSAFSSVENYDSLQYTLPESKHDGWVKRMLIRRALRVSNKYSKSSELLTVFAETFLHKLPYLLFLSLPFFALILKWLYSRRKNFYYSDHAVFTLYHYIFSFILLLLVFGVAGLSTWTDWRGINILTLLLCGTWPVYLFIEMKKFYQQTVVKTFGKFVLLNISASIVLIILFLVFFLFSIFQL